MRKTEHMKNKKSVILYGKNYSKVASAAFLLRDFFKISDVMDYAIWFGEHPKWNTILCSDQKLKESKKKNILHFKTALKMAGLKL